MGDRTAVVALLDDRLELSLIVSVELVADLDGVALLLELGLFLQELIDFSLDHLLEECVLDLQRTLGSLPYRV